MSRRRRKTAAVSQSHLEVLPGKGRRFAHLGKLSVFYIILGLFALLLLQAAYHWMEPFILSRRLQIVNAAVGRIENRVAVEGLLTRPEQLLTAPCSGVIVELAPPGERVPTGTAVASILPLTAAEKDSLTGTAGPSESSTWDKVKRSFLEWLGIEAGAAEPAGEGNLLTEALLWRQEDTVTLISPEAGLLLHRLDGWEGLGERAYLHAEQFAEGSSDEFAAAEGVWVEEGQPVLKLIDNWQWYYNLLLPLDQGRTLAARENVLFEFPFAPESSVTGALIAAEIDSAAEEVRLTYCIAQQFAGFEDLRWSAAEIVLERKEGILIPATALVEREGRSGVYLNRGGAVKFQEITVIGSRDDELMVEGLEPDSMVITRPGLVEEGRRLN